MLQVAPSARPSFGQFSSFDKDHWAKVKAARQEQGIAQKRTELPGHRLAGARVRNNHTNEVFTIIGAYQDWDHGWYTAVRLLTSDGRVCNMAILSHATVECQASREVEQFHREFSFEEGSP